MAISVKQHKARVLDMVGMYVRDDLEKLGYPVSDVVVDQWADMSEMNVNIGCRLTINNKIIRVCVPFRDAFSDSDVPYHVLNKMLVDEFVKLPAMQVAQAIGVLES